MPVVKTDMASVAGDFFSHIGTVLQAVPAGISQVARRHMRTRLEISNSVISTLWQLGCHFNPDHDKFSSLSNTTVVAIFPNLYSWQDNLCSNFGGIDHGKLYRATLTYAQVTRMPPRDFSFWVKSLRGQIVSEIKVLLFAFLAVCGLQGAVSKVSIPSKKVNIYM